MFDSDAGDQEVCCGTAGDTATISRNKEVSCGFWAHCNLKVRNGTDKKTWFVCIDCARCR